MDSAANHYDDEQDGADRMSAELEIVREQLSAIEAALPDYGPSFSALEHQTQQIKFAIDKIAASPSVALSAAEHASTIMQSNVAAAMAIDGLDRRVSASSRSD
jgi:ParB-like chromosome segregation protein Spo0J